MSFFVVQWMWLLIILGSGALFLAAWVVWRLRVYRSANSKQPCGSLHYQPGFIENLLRPADFVFLSAQPGYRPQIGRTLRRHRERIFRRYLCELAGDFHRTHRAAREMVSRAGAEHADVIGTLLRQQFTFWRLICGVELSLAAPRIAVPFCDKLRRDALAGLRDSIEAMRMDMARRSAVGLL